MRLAEWEALSNVRALEWKPDKPTRCIPDASIPAAHRPALFRLADFAVSSVIGGTVWLVPRGSFDLSAENRRGEV